MRFSLATLTRRTRNPRRKSIPLREIKPPATMAADLFRACYLPIVQAITARTDRIMAAYERALSSLTHDSPEDVTAELADMQTELDRLVLILTPRLRDWALRLERWERGKFVGAVLSATGVQLDTLLGASDVAPTVEASIQWNTALIRDVSDQARNRIAAAVFAGLQERKPAREVAANIREAVAMSRRRSTLIASDQLAKLSARLDQARQEQAGITEFIWRHSGKLHPRLYHLARNGKKYPWEGNGLNGDLPGVAPYCGCRAQAIISFE